MSNIYAPYREDAEEQHRYSVRHSYSATAFPPAGDPFELDVLDCSIDFNASERPYVRGSITAKVIEDQDTLDSLDPRKAVRVHVFMGYIYDGFVKDVNLVADLHIRTRTIDRPSNTMTLVLGGDEELAEDYKRMAWGPHAPTTGINEFVQFHANKASVPGTATVVSDFPAGYGATELAGMVQDVGQDSLSMLLDAAERLNVSVFCDGDRTWRIKKQSEIAGATALKLYVGAGGTILNAQSSLTRGVGEGKGFCNAVALIYRWKDSGGVDHVIYGNATVSAGPFATTAVGAKTFSEERQFPIASTALANQTASNLLKILAGRGNQMTLEAHAAYWLRPGHTVTVQLPAGDQQRFLVTQVQFNPTTGTMDLVLKQPINVTISTTSG
ncbi:hypothetical protein [Arthrobacter sp. NPDC056493]|uniref:hypothetical protein n=1 Tax=Arthrobacter sp. NPDC056493 TaxID=3345839 RepID=UPI00366FE5AB